MDISDRDLHKDMIKPSDNGGLESAADSVAQKVLIIDITLRSFIPPPVRKMTPKLCQICRYKLCIIMKDIQIDLNIFRKSIEVYTQLKSTRIYTRNILFITIRFAHYKHKVFPDGEVLHDSIRDAAQFITCIRTKPKNMIHVKSALGFYDGCSEYIIPHE